MSERERWIVYPLLFLALGAALRDKLFDMTTSKRIICQELMVVDEDPVGLRSPRPLARIGRIEGAGNGSAPVGFLYVDGQVEVNGPIVARQIAMRGVPYAPGIWSIIPPELWQAIQQSTEAWQKKSPSDADRSNTQPQPNEPAKTNVPATESKQAIEQPASEPSQ
jgi:hypothetical protein